MQISQITFIKFAWHLIFVICTEWYRLTLKLLLQTISWLELYFSIVIFSLS